MPGYRQYRGHRVLKAGVAHAIVLGLASLNIIAAYAETHPTKLDIHMRELLCVNQIRMCQASCQNNIQHNICHISAFSDTETLEWSCLCTSGTTNAFNDWQFPIPFKLCRRSLLTCLKSCQSLGESEMNQEPQSDSNRQRQQIRLSPPIENQSNLVNDYDEDDYDAIEEIQRLQRNLKLFEGSYSKFEKEGRARSILSEKRKQLHRQLWAKQRDEIISEKKLIENNNTPWKDITDFTTLSDPTERRDSTCVSGCLVAYSCGTETAPEFHGVLEISRSDHRNSVPQDNNLHEGQAS
ncbi:hypothetical protein BGX27_000253 [Mortierella sp. AM989]|nr:hypothetical protein BGX27_000253 [Mortierella sp. AM989]